jgi:hypothetical protein
MANLVIVALATQVVNLVGQLEASRHQEEVTRAQRDIALELADEAIRRAVAADPAKAGDLEIKRRVLKQGDLRLLEATRHRELTRIFDEML